MKKMMTKTILLLAIVALAACSATPVRRSMKESWNDTLTAEKIRYKLMKDKEVKKSRMHVEVFRGQVTLTGRAVSEAEKARAEQLVKSVKRVTSVENYVHVVGDGKSAPAVAQASKSDVPLAPGVAVAPSTKVAPIKSGAVIEEKTIIVEKETIKISEDDMPAITTARVATGSGQSAAAVASPARKSVETKAVAKAAKPAVKDTKLATVKKTPAATKPAVATAAPIKKVTPAAPVAAVTVKEAPAVVTVPALPKDAAVPMSSVPATKVVGKSKTGLPWDGEVYEDDASSIKATAAASRQPEKTAPAVPKSDDLAAEAAQELEKLRQKR